MRNAIARHAKTRRCGQLQNAVIGITLLSLLIFAEMQAAIPQYDTARPQDRGKLDSGTSPGLDETSGVAHGTHNPAVLWMHDDGGDANTNIYAMTKQNKVVRKWNLQGAHNGGWEAISLGPGPVAGESYIYVFDCGDNLNNRAKIDVYRFIEPSVAQSEIDSAPHYSSVTNVPSSAWKKASMKYPDRARDCEGAAIDPVSGDMYYFPKMYPAHPCTVWKITKANLENAFNTSVTATLTQVATGLQCSINATIEQTRAADFSADGHYFILKNESEGFMWEKGESATWDTVFQNVHTAPRYIRFCPSSSKNSAPGFGEAVCIDNTNNGLFTISEGSGIHLWFFAVDGGIESHQLTFTSLAAQDGHVIESTETSDVGGSSEVALTGGYGLRVGDTASRQQYKAFVSFDTSRIPDYATIVSAQLQLTRGGVSNNPSGLSPLCVDIRTGAFSGNILLEKIDFEAASTVAQVATLSYPSSDGTLSSGDLNAAGLSAINKTGITQLRIYFTSDDDGDSVADYLGFYPGDNATDALRPKLAVTWTGGQSAVSCQSGALLYR